MSAKKDPNPNDLIDSLVGGLQPVRPVRRVTPRALLWYGASLVVILGALAARLHFRSDLAGDFSHTSFLLTALALAFVAFTAMHATLHLSLPGRVERRMPSAVPVGVLAVLFIGLFGFSWVGEEAATWRAGLDLAGLKCAVSAWALSVLPVIMAGLMVRKLAPTEPRRVGALLGLAAGSLGALGIGLHCPSDQLLHWGVWHVLPAAILAGVAGTVLSRGLRW